MRRTLVATILLVGAGAITAAWVGGVLPGVYALATLKIVRNNDVLNLGLPVDQVVQEAWRRHVSPITAGSPKFSNLQNLLQPLPPQGVSGHVRWGQQDMEVSVVFYHKREVALNGEEYLAVVDLQFTPAFIFLANPSVSNVLTPETFQRLSRDPGAIKLANDLADEYYELLQQFSRPDPSAYFSGSVFAYNPNYKYSPSEAAQLRSYVGPMVVLMKHGHTIIQNDKQALGYIAPGGGPSTAAEGLRIREATLAEIATFVNRAVDLHWTYAYTYVAVDMRPISNKIRTIILSWWQWLIWIGVALFTPPLLVQLVRADIGDYTKRQIQEQGHDLALYPAVYQAVIWECPFGPWWTPRSLRLKKIINWAIAKSSDEIWDREFLADANFVYQQIKAVSRRTNEHHNVEGLWRIVEDKGRTHEVRADALRQIKLIASRMSQDQTSSPNEPTPKPTVKGEHVPHRQKAIDSLPPGLRQMKTDKFWKGLSASQLDRVGLAYSVLGSDTSHLLASGQLGRHLKQGSKFLTAILSADKQSALDSLS